MSVNYEKAREIAMKLMFSEEYQKIKKPFDMRYIDVKTAKFLIDKSPIKDKKIWTKMLMDWYTIINSRGWAAILLNSGVSDWKLAFKILSLLYDWEFFTRVDDLSFIYSKKWKGLKSKKVRIFTQKYIGKDLYVDAIRDILKIKNKSTIFSILKRLEKKKLIRTYPDSYGKQKLIRVSLTSDAILFITFFGGAPAPFENAFNFWFRKTFGKGEWELYNKLKSKREQLGRKKPKYAEMRARKKLKKKWVDFFREYGAYLCKKDKSRTFKKK